MGPEAEHVIQSFIFDATNGETENDYGTVLGNVNAHFVPKRNIIHERGRFCQRVQLSGETVEEFVRHLHEIAEHCDFGFNKEKFLRDRIVIGMADKNCQRGYNCGRRSACRMPSMLPDSQSLSRCK